MKHMNLPPHQKLYSPKMMSFFYILLSEIVIYVGRKVSIFSEICKKKNGF